MENNVFLQTGNGGSNFLSGGSLAGVSEPQPPLRPGLDGDRHRSLRRANAHGLAATSQDANSLIQDPAFLSLDPASASFATPPATSPVVGKGVPLGAALGFHGNLRGAATDIGAAGGLGKAPSGLVEGEVNSIRRRMAPVLGAPSLLLSPAR